MMMTSSDALPEAVLKRKAVVYVQQSTQAQSRPILRASGDNMSLSRLPDAAAFETSK